MNNKIILFISILMLSSCATSSLQKSKNKPVAKNIILLIGDGMGLTQTTTAFIYSDTPPNFSRFKQIGLHLNKPIGARLTDSAAGATAFSIGEKTYNGAIGVTKDTIAKKTILEMASENGKSTGLVVTSSLMHATPAAFYAHVSSRSLYEKIALQFVNSNYVDIAIGGGYQYLNNRKDGQDLIKKLRQKGTVVDTSALNKNETINKKYAYFLAPDGMPKMQNGRGNFLSDATQCSLDYLSQNNKGFFLMVEGSQIDWGGHQNDADYIIEEVKDFDKAVGVALDFAERDKNTLVIVTADHETGGFSLTAAKVFGKLDYRQISPAFTSTSHSAALIPVYTFGPGADEYIGIYENNDIFYKMVNSFLNK
ncbi:MAG TPA: alkaline phosphatase [Bacteroidetes bacterium]|nr:alkaline phosphatase [Bacteroidota bacterium]